MFQFEYFFFSPVVMDIKVLRKICARWWGSQHRSLAALPPGKNPQYPFTYMKLEGYCRRKTFMTD